MCISNTCYTSAAYSVGRETVAKEPRPQPNGEHLSATVTFGMFTQNTTCPGLNDSNVPHRLRCLNAWSLVADGVGRLWSL